MNRRIIQFVTVSLLFALLTTGVSSQNAGIIRIVWSPDGDLIATANWDGTIAIIDSSNGQIIQTLIGHTSGVNDVAWSPDSRRIASASGDKTVRIWSVGDGVLQHTLTGHKDTVSSVLWNPSGASVYSGSIEEPRTLRMWDTLTGNALFNAQGGSIYDLVLDPTTEILTSANPVGGVGFFSTSDLEFIDYLEHPEGVGKGFDVYRIMWNQDGSQLTTGSLNGSVRTWDIHTKQILLDLYATDDPEISFETTSVQVLWLNSDENILISIAADGTARVWNAITGELFHEIQLSSPIESAAFSPDGSQLAYAKFNSTTLHFVPTSQLINPPLPGPTRHSPIRTPPAATPHADGHGMTTQYETCQSGDALPITLPSASVSSSPLLVSSRTNWFPQGS